MWHHPEMSRWEHMRSKVNSRTCVTIRGQNEYAWGQRLGYEVRGQDTIKGHTCHRIDLWPHSYSLWPHSMTSHPQINFKLLWFSLTWRNCILVWLTKIATASLLIATHHWFFQLEEDKMLILDNWQNTSYVLIQSHFSNCLLLFDTPCIVNVAGALKHNLDRVPFARSLRNKMAVLLVLWSAYFFHIDMSK